MVLPLLTLTLSCNINSYMKQDSKLSSVLHVLLHMAHHGRPLTSEELSKYLSTNPVVVRRTLAGLRERGWLQSEKGHGGGWRIVCDLKTVSLGDVYRALGEPALIAMGHRSDNPTCLVEQAVQRSLNDAVSEAEAILMARLDAVTLADLAADFSEHAPNHPHPHAHEDHPHAH